MMKVRLFSIVLIVMLIFSSTTLLAQNIQEGVEKDRVRLRSESSRHNRNDNIYIAREDVLFEYRGDEITSQKLRWERDANKAYFSIDVELLRKDGDRIKSNTLDFDTEKDILIAQEDVRLDSTLRDRQLNLTGNYLKIWIDSNDMIAKEEVFVIYDGQEIRGDRLDYKDQKEEMKVTGRAQIEEDDQLIEGEEILIYLDSGSLDAQGDVVLTRDDGDIIKGNSLKVDGDEEHLVAEENVSLNSKRRGKPLDLTAGYLKIWTDTNNMLAKEDVFVIYDGQEIRGDRLDYDDQKEEMVVTGSAEIREDGQWMRSRRIVIYLEDGFVDAQGQVEIEFDI